MKWLIFLGLFSFLSWAEPVTDWPASLKGIGSGEQAWLEKVPDLAATADVQQAVKLEDALAAALSKNTAGILATLSIIDGRTWPHMVGTDIVCGVPVERPAAVVEDVYQQTRLALLTTDKGATCLWILEASYEEWKTDNARTNK